jgi:hypothetical protein
MPDENEGPEGGAREAGVRTPGKRLPMHPDVARAYLKQKAHDDLVHIVAILKAKRELTDRKQEGPVPPGIARAFIEQRSQELMEQIEVVLKAKRELANREQEGPVNSGQCGPSPDAESMPKE